MGKKHGGTEPGAAGGPPVRRDFLQKAAAAGTAAFALPMIITVDPADAQALTSPPPEPPGSERKRRQARTELPRTGDGIDRLVAAGLTATASGAALMLWSAELESSSPAPQPSDSELET